MKKYIENIRVSVKKKGYIPTSDQIRRAIDIVCPDGKNILENKTAIVSEAIKLINLSHELTLTPTEKPDNNLLNSDPNDTPNDDSNHPENKSSDLIEEIIPDNSPLRHMPQRGEPPHGSGSPTPDDEINSAEIVVTQEDKSEVITAQASAYGIELSEVEVLELTSNVGDRFTDYIDFVRATKQAIKSYTEQRYDSLERQIESTSEDLKSYFEHRERRLNQKLATGLGEMNNFFRTKSVKQKELSKIIAAAFKI